MPAETRSKAGTRFPTPKKLDYLKITPEVAWYLIDRGYGLPDRPPLYKTPEGTIDPDATFSPDKVDDIVNAFKHLRHTTGRWAGQPLVPDVWQVAYILAPIFGWVKHSPDTGTLVRVVRNAYVEMPRKNGKSTVGGGIALYLTGADSEPGAQVIAAASTKEQAGFVFAPVKQLVESSPALRGRFLPRTGQILHPKSGSYFRVVSSLADAQHGANIHGGIIDELHVHKTPDLVNTIETGTGSREQPLVMIITTADDAKPNTIYARRRKSIERLAKGIFTDPKTYGVIFAAPDDADPFLPATWAGANPGYPISPTHTYLEDRANKARTDPAELHTFKRLHLGQRTRQGIAYISLDAWKRNDGPGRITEASMMGRPCFGGLDLGSVSDLTAFCLLFPRDPDDDNETTIRYDAIWRFWTPEDNLRALDKRTADAASTWVDQRWLTTTPGNVTDYDFIRAQINDDADMFDIQTVGIDLWNGTHLASQLMKDGIDLVETRQGYKTMSPAMKEIQRLVLGGRPGREGIRNGGNPVMRWMIDNLAVAVDPAGNVKPDKKRSEEKIDGVSALANAISEAISGADTDDDSGDDITIMMRN